jgi:hypothetical protein
MKRLNPILIALIPLIFFLIICMPGLWESGEYRNAYKAFLANPDRITGDNLRMAVHADLRLIKIFQVALGVVLVGLCVGLYRINRPRA